MEKLDDIVFYTIDKAIRTYRQYAQRQIKLAGYDITIDQWLVIKNILEHPDIRQQDLGEKVFKDNASVTRIISLLVKAKYLKREIHDSDGRRASLTVTAKGLKIIEDVNEVVLKNRAAALKGIAKPDIETMKNALNVIAMNCSRSNL